MEIYTKRQNAIFRILFISFFVAQIIFWYNTKKLLPELVIINNPPKAEVASAIALGDDQFYFRYLALELQNSGDGYGRFTPLKDYNYRIVKNWLLLLDHMDSKSNFAPSIAAYYYGITQYKPDVRHIVEYLNSHYDRDPKEKWWWLSQAVHLANHRYKDKDWALELAIKLSKSPAENMPIWGRQMPAFIHEQLGEERAAYNIIMGLLRNVENLKKEELNFMEYFIKHRIKDKSLKEYIDSFNRDDFEHKVESR